ncbi:MAG: Wzz/FepE/Etk N-terminal domain-containing protein [Chitinophagaceae bacterium]
MMSEPSFNLIQTVGVLRAWKKQLVLILVVALVVSTLVAFLIPPQYVSQAVLLPANPSLGDRSNLFRTDFELPGNYFGNGDDLDRLLAEAQAPSVIRYLVDRFGLVDHYGIRRSQPFVNTKAARELKKHLEVEKTELSTLRITVWDRNPQMAAELANGAVEKIRTDDQQLLITARSALVSALEKHLGLINLQLSQLQDSILDPVRKEQLKKADLHALEHYQSLVGEFQTSLDNHIPDLYVLQRAYPAQKPGYPVKWIVVVASTLATMFFSILGMGLLEYYRKIKPLPGNGK